MSGHADTIRRVREVASLSEQELDLLEDAANALDALVAENQQQAALIRLQAEEIDVFDAENQQLRDALTFYAERRNLHVEWSGETQIRDRGQVARAALAGTPSEDTE